MKPTMPIAICLAGDSNAAYGIALAATSAVSNCSITVRVYIVDYGMGPNEIELIRSSLKRQQNLESLHFITPTEQPFRDISNSRFPPASLARISIPDLVTEALVIYLDYDVIVHTDLINLFSYLKPESLFAAAVDTNRRTLASLSGAIDLLGKSACQRPYFNSGVMLINCDQWRAKEISSYLKKRISELKGMTFEYADQCFLNYTLYNKWSPLPNIYNWMVKLDAEKYELGPMCRGIIHFAGMTKAWSFVSSGSCGIVKLHHSYRIKAGLPELGSACQTQPHPSMADLVTHKIRMMLYLRKLSPGQVRERLSHALFRA